MSRYASERRLIWIPIIHTQEDMGRLRDSVRRLYIERHGQKKWDEHLRALEALWREIRRRIMALGPSYEHVRLYQDGLPVCGREEVIVHDLARAGSENHHLLVDLMSRGATLTGTESPQLLLQEYELALRLLGGHGASAPIDAAAFKEQSRTLLEQRDRFIADRIDQTLQAGETGLVLLGMLHSLDGHLASDIQVMKLDLTDIPGFPSRSAC